jgi:hypothetical protein
MRRCPTITGLSSSLVLLVAQEQNPDRASLFKGTVRRFAPLTPNARPAPFAIAHLNVRPEQVSESLTLRPVLSKTLIVPQMPLDTVPLDPPQQAVLLNAREPADTGALLF